MQQNCKDNLFRINDVLVNVYTRIDTYFLLHI